MNRLFVIAGLVILVIALIFLNQGIQKAGPPDSEDAPPTAAAPAAKTPAAPPGPSAPASDTSALPAEQTLGNPATAKHHIQVGWSYSGSSRQKPETLRDPFRAVDAYVRQSGNVSAEIVSVDVPAADRSPSARTIPGRGVYVDGKKVIDGDISTQSVSQIMKAVAAATK